MLKKWSTTQKTLAVVVIILAILLFTNWSTVKGWFKPSEKVEILDANGNSTGTFINTKSSALSRQVSCCASGRGFVGNCKFPITKTDRIPACGSL